MKKILLIIMIGMFFINMVSAADYIGRQYDNVFIIDNCEVDGFPCDVTYLCNITISDPDLNLIILNEPMTRNDTIYNYTIIETDILGGYALSIYCDNTTFSGHEDYILKITTTGREPNLVVTLLLILSSLGLFILALYLKNYAMGFISGILFTIAGVYVMIYGLGNVADLYTRSIALILIAFGSFVTLIAGIEWLDDEGD